jgi:hypothetical protein
MLLSLVVRALRVEAAVRQAKRAAMNVINPREPLAYSQTDGPCEKVDNNMGLLNLRPGQKAADRDCHHQLNDL